MALSDGIRLFLFGNAHQTQIFFCSIREVPRYRTKPKKIKGFVQSLAIDLSEAKIEDIGKYSTFNEFFTRELKPSRRPLCNQPEALISPADGRVFAWENIDIDLMVQVKGLAYTLADLLQDQALALAYSGGTCLVIRLCPADYHRFHFPDSGVPGPPQQIKGSYYSVNPLALHKIIRLYCRNKRELTVFRSDHFGDMLLLEVGATCVGSIIQTYSANQHVAKGSEKGYFKFGGSTVIVLFKKDRVKLDEDILDHTVSGFETKILMGERLGVKLK